ncbi:hypothetical protein RHSIM_Rhsim09G0150200 [Rhododendron simsii]|uniref:Uncharacterized protein n=1 Tax=Rhododendron simsii TaxID=118357 RepID=A0A834GJX7_RHOSS|nr:hypothetical protein RHSIM_Rhsim09G0150200 [Rhododendron simsii]
MHWLTQLASASVEVVPNAIATNAAARHITTSKRVVASKDFNLEKNGSGMKLSFADLLKGKDMEPSKITVKAKEDTFVDGNDWLLRSVIGKLPSLRSVESIKDTFYSEGVFDIQIKSLGGYYVVLTFPSIEAMLSMIEGPEVNLLGVYCAEFRYFL